MDICNAICRLAGAKYICRSLEREASRKYKCGVWFRFLLWVATENMEHKVYRGIPATQKLYRLAVSGFDRWNGPGDWRFRWLTVGRNRGVEA
jgi:hypothetical protein